MALPATIQTIVGLIGYGQTMALVGDLGGQDFRFPAAGSRQSANWEHLFELVGPRDADRLVRHFDGSEVYIAQCHRALKADRNRKMIARYDALLQDGHSSRGAVSVLVREFKLSNRQVEKIVNGPMPSAAPEMVAQGSLF